MITFFDLFESLSDNEKRVFREKIMRTCSIKLPTWYSWVRRKKIAKQSQILIAMELNQPIHILFPEK